jgi:MazG family protein
MSNFNELVTLVATLRGEGGCPWDRAQTHETMVPYLIEETYEVVDAIEQTTDAELAKELGDLLFQVLFHAQLGAEREAFDIESVSALIRDKMIERHPHVFGDGEAEESDPGSVGAWEARKAKERGDRSMMDGIPRQMPALLRAHRVGEKVSRVGFDWPSLSGVLAKVDEELGELRAAIDSGESEAIEHEYGDLLLAAANLGRFVGVGGEEALRHANDRFARRFRVVERLALEGGIALFDADDATLESLWSEAKRLENAGEV